MSDIRQTWKPTAGWLTAVLWLLAVVGTSWAGQAGLRQAAYQKIDAIVNGRLPSGTIVKFSHAELLLLLNDHQNLLSERGIYQPKFQLGRNQFSVKALVDFSRLQEDRSMPVDWFYNWIFSGTRLVEALVNISSANGLISMQIKEVSVDGTVIPNRMLSYLVPLVAPELEWVISGKAQELPHNLERIEVYPEEVQVVIGAAKTQ